MTVSGKANTQGLPPICNDMGTLAPKFRERVEKALLECSQIEGLDPIVYETLRSQDLQTAYYARGRTVVPPYQPVTEQADVQHSWHAFGLAVDIISRTRGWDTDSDWQQQVATVFKRNGIDWGNDWPTFKDYPHFQFGGMKQAPSDLARQLYQTGGLQAVWEAVGAA